MTRLTSAQRRLVEEFQGNASALAWRWAKKTPIDHDELQSVAFLALCEAAARFRAGSVTFPAYYKLRVNGAIIDFLRKQYGVAGVSRKRNYSRKGEWPGAPEVVSLSSDHQLVETVHVPGRLDPVRDVLKHLKALPCREARTLLRWAVDGDAGVGAVAREMDRSRALVYLLRCRAIDRLRERLL